MSYIAFIPFFLQTHCNYNSGQNLSDGKKKILPCIMITVAGQTLSRAWSNRIMITQNDTPILSAVLLNGENARIPWKKPNS